MEPKCYYYRVGADYRNVKAMAVMVLDEAFAAKLVRLRATQNQAITQSHVQ